MKAKIENGKLVIISESAGERIALEIWRESNESIILDGYSSNDCPHCQYGLIVLPDKQIIDCIACSGTGILR